MNLSFLCLVGNLKISAPEIYEQASKVEWKSTNWGWIVDSQSGKPSILAENAGKIKGQADVECNHQENTGMAEKENVDAREAKHGEKMIELKIRFWTDELCEPGKVIPKHALTAGVVRIKPNKAHGISPGKARPFNSLLDLGASIEKVLKEHGIVLHPSSGMRSYISESK